MMVMLVLMLMVILRYGEQGFVEELPSLSMGRHSHGCAAYIDTEGVKVGRWGLSNVTNILLQVYLVTGGYDGYAK